MSFGFGVGDFIAVATLAWKVSIALREMKGTGAAFKQLVTDIEFSAQALYQFESVLSQAGLPIATRNVVGYGLACCHTELDKLNGIIKMYQASMGVSHVGTAFKLNRCIQGFKWEVFEKQGVNEARENITKSITQIALVLNAHGVETLTRMDSRIRENAASLKRIEAAIPRDLGYTWTVDYKPIVLEDVLGRRMPIPYELGSKWESFIQVLKVAFTDRPGSSWIAAGRFNITAERGGLLKPKDWDKNIQPNMKLDMSMTISKTADTELGSHLNECPSCGAPYEGYSPITTLGHVQCTRCLLWYALIMGPRVEELEEDEERASTLQDRYNTHAQNDIKANKLPPKVDVNEDDIKSFKRVDVIMQEAESEPMKVCHGLYST